MFGLFSSNRTKAVRAAVTALEPMIGSLQSSVGPGIPPFIWEDPYILGFTHCTIDFFANMWTGGKIDGVDLGYVLAQSYAAVTHMNGEAIAKRAIEFKVTEHPKFKRGVSDAKVLHFFSHSMLKDEDTYLLVDQAKKKLKATGRPLDRSAVGGMMWLDTWTKEVKRLSNV